MIMKILIPLLFASLCMAQQPARRWSGGTTAPTSGACDAAAEVGSIYIQSGDPASVSVSVWVCLQKGASTYGWMPSGHQTGTTLPAVCTTGMLFFKTDATIGQNLYGCTSSDTWTLLRGTGDVQGPSNTTNDENCLPVWTNTNRLLKTGGTGTIKWCIDATTGELYSTSTDPTLSTYTDHSSDPAAPAASKTSIYTKSGRPWFRANGGSATELVSGGGASGDGEIAAYSGTGGNILKRSFAAFSGPATSVKTYTLPNVSTTILTTNDAVTVAQGGTGATTLTGLLQGNGTSAITAITNSSTTGQVLRVTGASTYGWGALDLANANAITGILPGGNGGTGNGFFAVSGPASSLKTFTFPNASATVLTSNAAVTSAQGGTGANNTATAGRYLRGDGSNFVTSAVAAAGAGSCTNQFVRATVDNAAPTCATVVAADADSSLAKTGAGNTWTTGTQDMSNATATKPNKTVTVLPGTCAVGETVIKTDAPAASQHYVCSSTNTWTAQGGGATPDPATTGTWQAPFQFNYATTKTLTAANRVRYQRFTPSFRQTVTHINVRTTAGSNGMVVGLYNSACDTKLAEGAKSGGGNSGHRLTLTSSVTLEPNVSYWLAFASEDNSHSWQHSGTNNEGLIIAEGNSDYLADGPSGSNLASGSGASLTLPSSCGTKVSLSGDYNVIAAVFHGS